MDPNNPLYSNPIYLAVTDFLRDDGMFVYVNVIAVVVTTILFFVYCFSKEGRDEHGRAIIGTACVYGLVALVILMNIFSGFTWTVISDVWIFTNSIRLVYNGYMLTVLISIAILRKIR